MCSEMITEDFYIKLNGEDNFLGRITVNKQGHFFSAEIDIVLKESKKINDLPTFEVRGNVIKVKRKDFVKQQQAYM